MFFFDNISTSAGLTVGETISRTARPPEVNLLGEKNTIL